MPDVVLTRAPEDNAPLARALRERGAVVIELPCVRVEHLADPSGLAAALRDLGPNDTLVFTSRAGVDAARRALGTERPRTRVAAVGEFTAARCREWGVSAWTPRAATGEALGRELPVVDGIVVLARAERSDKALPRELARRGARVRELVAYRVLTGATGGVAEASRALAGGASVVLASPSAAEAVVAAVGGEVAVRARALALGPTTARRWLDLTGSDAWIITRLSADNVLDAIDAADR